MANLADTYFTGATIDGVAMQSVVRALNWRKAHFDPAIRQELERLSAGEERATGLRRRVPHDLTKRHARSPAT
jgi:hypothetical protein